MIMPASDFALHGLIVATFLLLAPVAHAQTPGKVDLEAVEAMAELLGAPVFASDGTEVGEVADLLVDEEGQIARLRMKTGALLGIGMRTIEIPGGAFVVLRGAVVLELPAESVEALPEHAEFIEER
jgi:sporulation protein YlmC with PRC-barrel domain